MMHGNRYVVLVKPSGLFSLTMYYRTSDKSSGAPKMTPQRQQALKYGTRHAAEKRAAQLRRQFRWLNYDATVTVEPYTTAPF